jgi:hypothetical protein
MSLATASSSAAPIATIESPPCPTPVATWHIAYRMFWVSSLGQTTSRAALPAVLEEAQEFANDVQEDSACGVRVSLDVYDEGQAIWPASPESATVPADTDSLMAAGGYDWTFFRMPTNGENFCAVTYVDAGPAEGTAPSASRFPVDPEGALGCAGPGSGDCACEPWRTLMEHEWLHAVVSFYNPRLGWPVNDVHAACEHGYDPGPCPSAMTDEHYFADMMQGRVLENGSPRGIQPDEWTLQGTPAHPLIQHPTVTFTSPKIGVMGVEIPPGLAGLATATYEGGSPTTSQTIGLATAQSTIQLPGPGNWNVCVKSPGSEAFYRSERCASLYVPRVRTPTTTKTGHGTVRPRTVRPHLRIRHHLNRYRIIASGLPAGSRAELLVKSRRRHWLVSGRRTGTTERFSLVVHGSRPLRVRLWVHTEGRTTSSRVYRIHPARLSRR